MDLDRIEALIEVVKDAKVMELSVMHEGSSVVVKKSPKAAVQPMKMPKPVSGKETLSSTAKKQAEIAAIGTMIKAPMVGIFHVADGFTVSGSLVKKGQVIGSIESMKLMNDVVSVADGSLAEIFVEDGMPVEYGQSLFRLDNV